MKKTKFCHACQTLKPSSDFSRNKGKKDGLDTQCQKCHELSRRRWMAKNPEKKLAYSKANLLRYREKYKSDPEYRRKACLKAKRWRDKLTPEQLKAWRRNGYLRFNYKIKDEHVEQMWIDQDGKCACCTKPLKKENKYAVVDHDHKTGQVNGLLCRRCNNGLGAFGDDIDQLKRAIAYLKRVRKAKAKTATTSAT